MIRRAVSHIRPAPLQVAVARLLRLDRPLVVEDPHSGLTPPLKMLVNPAGHFGGHMINGGYEANTVGMLTKRLKPGMTFLDLGANIGYYTALGSRLVGPSGHVIAVEPQSRLQASIAKNLQLNRCYNVRTVQAAITDASGTVQIHLASEANTGGSGLYRSTRYALPTETVRAMTLDELLNEATPTGIVDFAKVDIVGAEEKLVTSSRELLASGRIKSVWLDIHESILRKRGIDSESLRVVMRQCGYRETNDDSVWVHSSPS